MIIFSPLFWSAISLVGFGGLSWAIGAYAGEAVKKLFWFGLFFFALLAVYFIKQVIG